MDVFLLVLAAVLLCAFLTVWFAIIAWIVLAIEHWYERKDSERSAEQ